MTREETIKVLAILKAAYPNSYKNMTKEEANGTVAVWSMQFSNIPVEVVMIAINKLISTSTFPPAICEVKDKIRGLYWEVWQQLKENEHLKLMAPEEEATLRNILGVVEPLYRNGKTEPTVCELTGGIRNTLLIGGDR